MEEFDIIIMGCGSSTGTPSPRCILNNKFKQCKVCESSLNTSPLLNPNYRGNPSIIIKTYDDHILQIDMPKNFRENGIRWFPKHDIKYINTALLTHPHADAMFGIDDLRNFQLLNANILPKRRFIPISIYISQNTKDDMMKTFSYLFPETYENNKVFRPVANLHFHVLQDLLTFHPIYPKLKGPANNEKIPNGYYHLYDNNNEINIINNPLSSSSSSLPPFKKKK